MVLRSELKRVLREGGEGVAKGGDIGYITLPIKTREGEQNGLIKRMRC